MASRLPVIVSDLPGPRRVVLDGEAGLIVAARNPQRLARAMIELARDAAKRERLAENALQRAREFDSDAVIGELIEWLQDGREWRRGGRVERTATRRNNVEDSAAVCGLAKSMEEGQ